MATQYAVFAGGCFWCTEAVFRELKGVVDVTPGYAGGTVANPTYEQVSSGTTGHAEAIRFEYDPQLISYDQLLTVFFATHDPTTVDRQGNDIGPQYRSVIFTMNDEQRAKAAAKIAALNAASTAGAPVVTEVRPLEAFWPAEDYHRRYYEKHQNESYCRLVINPKLDKLQREFSDLLRRSVADDAIVAS